MAGGVSNGQAVSAPVTNPAFIFKNADDTVSVNIGWVSSAGIQGPSIVMTQRQFNSICSFLGLAPNQVYNFKPTWTDGVIGTNSDDIFTKVFNLITAFLGSGFYDKAGKETPSSGDSFTDVTFATAMPNTNYTVDVTMENSVDTPPAQIFSYLSNLTINGFRINYGAPVDTSDYVFHWQVKRNYNP